jgi:hypothetical protein
MLRVINGPLADRHQDARRAVIIVIFLALALGFDVGVDAGMMILSAPRAWCWQIAAPRARPAELDQLTLGCRSGAAPIPWSLE